MALILKCHHDFNRLCLDLFVIKKEYEPYLLIPIAFGMLLANLPWADCHRMPKEVALLSVSRLALGIYPPMILGVGASTDFGPLIASPKEILGAAAQFSIFLLSLVPSALATHRKRVQSVLLEVRTVRLLYI